MNNLLSKFKISVAVSALNLGVISAPAIAVEDVLKTPSVQSEKSTEALLLDIAKAGKRVVAVGSRGHVVFSDNGGQSWEQASVPVSVLLTAVSFADEKNGWAVGHSGVVLKTNDSGLSWRKQFDGDAANQMIIKQSERHLQEMESKLDSASEDELEDLEYEVEEAAFALDDAKLDAEVGASKPLLDVLFTSKNEGFVVGAYGYLFKTNNGGGSWSNYGARIDNPDRFHLNAINKTANGSLFVVGEAGVIFRSQDDGESWEALDSPYSGSLFGVTGTSERNVVLVFGLRGNLFRSEDNGDSWEPIDTGSEGTLMSAASNGGNKLSIIGNSGVVLYSDNEGKTFKETIRKDRLGNASSLYLDSNRMVMVGESGVKLTTPTGVNL